MERLNFASYAHAIQAGTANIDPTNMVKLLIEPITESERVVNAKGNIYNITSKEALEWWNEEANIPENICYATARPDILSKLSAYFEKDILERLILPQRENNVFSLLINLVNKDDSIPSVTRIDFEKLYEEGDYSNYLLQLFLYAITVLNDGKKPKSKIKSKQVKIKLNEFYDQLAKLPQLVEIQPPEEYEAHELRYVTELCAAYSEDAGEDITKEKIDSYSKYYSNFMRQRIDYYHAESVRQATRDIFSSEDEDVFEDFKNEVYSAVVDLYEDEEDEPAYKKMKDVVKCAANANTSRSVLNYIPKWIGPEQRKGTCHMLVNDERLKWVKKNE